MSKINSLRRTLCAYPLGRRLMGLRRSRSVINKKTHDTFSDKGVINKKNNHLANNNKDDEDLHLVAWVKPLYQQTS